MIMRLEAICSGVRKAFWFSPIAASMRARNLSISSDRARRWVRSEAAMAVLRRVSNSHTTPCRFCLSALVTRWCGWEALAVAARGHAELAQETAAHGFLAAKAAALADALDGVPAAFQHPACCRDS